MKFLAAMPWLLFLPGAALTQAIPLDDPELLGLHKVVSEIVTNRGRRALRITEAEGFRDSSPDKLVIIRGLDFQNGIIEVDVAGQPVTGAQEGARGFIGVAFHVSPGASHYECIYLLRVSPDHQNPARAAHAPDD